VAELLAVEGLTVGFRTDDGLAQVLDSASLRIGQGEVVGLVGESGCGKTTLARAILGVLPTPPAQIGGGTIRFRGQDLLEFDRRRLTAEIRGRAITFIPQDPYGSFNPLFTVGAQIRDLMRWKAPKAGRERVIELLRQVQIPEPERALDKLPHEFSGGQRQRLMIAMALLPEPDLIIADEPTTALDVTIQAQILKLLRDLVKDRGISVLLTTHDLGTAWEICDRVSVLYAGQDMESAPTARFFDHAAHQYTRALLASLPDPEGEIRDIPGEVPSLLQPPAGCRFHPRCTAATEACRARPPVRELAADHILRCHHPAVTA
jgi:peptide/nickel transport system ATP-binding protein